MFLRRRCKNLINNVCLLTIVTSGFLHWRNGRKNKKNNDFPNEKRIFSNEKKLSFFEIVNCFSLWKNSFLEGKTAIFRISPFFHWE